MSCDRLISISERGGRCVAKCTSTSSAESSRTPHQIPERRRRSTLRERPLRFVVASRWNRWKDTARYCAWDLAGCPGQLDVLGGPPLSGEVTDVPATVARLAVPETVRIVGEVADPAKFLCGADVAVIPSDEPEPFGLVAIEAFARGRPVVASAAGGLLDIVTDGYDGWTFEPGDVAALAAILRSLTVQAVVTAGDRARRTFEQRYTIERYRREWLDAVGLDR
ncbi:MAG: glycosyltransferase family 4 protein [Ilumatobacteraceae bacterium]